MSLWNVQAVQSKRKRYGSCTRKAAIHPCGRPCRTSACSGTIAPCRTFTCRKSWAMMHFCKVYHGIFQMQQVAVKVLARDSFRTSEWEIFADLSRHRHPHILSTRACFLSSDTNYLVSELILGSDLETFLLEVASDVDAQEFRFQAPQIVQAMEFLHNNMIGHFDLKGGNLMVDRSRCLKIIDFGMAEVVNAPLTARKMSTAHYLAPEIMLTKRQVEVSQGYGLPADMWSFGINLYHLWTYRVQGVKWSHLVLSVSWKYGR